MMTESNPLPQPSGLGKRAGSLWDGITKDYKLRIDEIAILEHACREIDIIDRMEEYQRGGDLIGFGSQGQPVAAPMLAELRQHRALFASLMTKLHLPDDDSGTIRRESRTSEQARKAANARWGRNG
jgi:hypothetical protein